MLNESHACAAAAWAASRLCTSLDAGAAPSDTETEDASFTALEAADPVAEMAAVADAVQAALEAGTNPSSIYILAFHPAWERCIARALEARGIAAALPIRGRVAAGDYRDLDRCAPARLLTALALVADPTDALAWRAWCGFGDYLANSAAFADMRAEGETQGKGLVAMLEKVAVAAPEEGFPAQASAASWTLTVPGVPVERAGPRGNERSVPLPTPLDLSAEERERTVQLASALTAPEPGVNAPSDARAMIARARQRERPCLRNHGGPRAYRR
ncbi:MAG: hypothetical protein ACLUW6_08140 [Coriobacteriaceae bacterium]